MTLLEQVIDALDRGRLQVVDLTQPLGPDTPVIGLPAVFAASPGVSIDVISRYDERGPAWYWNTLRFGEHTGTHFDAPVHWISGKNLPENACDTISPRRFIGPACVIDVTSDVAADPDFLLTTDRVRQWEAEHGRIPEGAWVLLRTGWSRRTGSAEFLNVGPDGPHSPGIRRPRVETAGARAPNRRRWCRNDRHGRRPGGDVRSAVPEPRDYARRGMLRARKPVQSRSVAVAWGNPDCRTAQDRRRQRQPAARSRDCGGGRMTGQSRVTIPGD